MEFVSIASSSERPSLERLEKFLRHHGIECRIAQSSIPAPQGAERFALQVEGSKLETAKQVLESIHVDPDHAEEVLEISLDGTERIEVASWLQILLDEHDNEGSPIYFFRPEYEAILDSLHETGRMEVPIYILKGLRSFIPEMQKRVVMASALQEFFSLIEAVSEGEA
jgi:hypothetical protein